MSEGSRRCYHKIWTWGVKTGCLCLALLHSVASGRGRGFTAEGAGGAEGEGFRRGERGAPPRSSAALSFEGRFQTCPYHRPGGGIHRRGRGGRRGGRPRFSRGRATTSPYGDGRRRWGRVGGDKGRKCCMVCILLHFRLLLSCRGDSRVAPTGGGRGRGREDGFLPPQE